MTKENNYEHLGFTPGDITLLTTPVKILLAQPGSETEDGRDLSAFRRAVFLKEKVAEYNWQQPSFERKSLLGDETGSTGA